jgi:hypothetical protein
MAAAATTLSEQQTGLSAAELALTKVVATNLFDYIK